MNHAEKVECVRAGLGHEPTEQEIAYWLYGIKGVSVTASEQVALLESVLKDSPNDWQIKVFRLMRRIPSGTLVSYGNLAKWAN